MNVIIKWNTGQVEKREFSDIIEANKWLQEQNVYSWQFKVRGEIVKEIY